MDVAKIGMTQYYLQKIEDYINNNREIEDEKHVVITLQRIYVYSKNLYNKLYKVRREEVFSLNGSGELFRINLEFTH
jgi:hypothetical protein